MTELVTAVFDAPSKAEAAAQDLEVARIPSAVIRRQIDPESGASTWHVIADIWHSRRSEGRPLVTVAVDEIHATIVTGILNQHQPLELEAHSVRRHR